MRVLQTSAHEQGQIYVPVVNLLLFVFVCVFVLGFGSSDALAGAYGAAVVGTMFITTILGAFVAVTQWGWPSWAVGALFSGLFCLDGIFVVGQHDQDTGRRLGAADSGDVAVRRVLDLALRSRGPAARARGPGPAADDACRSCWRMPIGCPAPAYSSPATRRTSPPR